jgi:hypothetical protein
MNPGRRVLRAGILCACLGALVTVIACWEDLSLVLPMSPVIVSLFVGVGVKHANAYDESDSAPRRRREQIGNLFLWLSCLSGVGFLVWLQILYHTR